VLLADASEFVQEIPELKSLQERWLQEEKKLLKHTRKLVKDRDTKSLSKRVEKVRELVLALPEGNLADQVLAAVDEAYARVIRSHSVLDAENIPGIHTLRIAFKKFRYAVEIVQPLLADFPTANFERMHDYQSRMGDIQDMEVARQKLTELKPASRLNLEAVSVHYASRLRTAVLPFLEDNNEVLVFWRKSPDQPFPWEKSS
jgi:CHAD domain-containing protein